MSARRQKVAEALMDLRRRLFIERRSQNTVDVVDLDAPEVALAVFHGDRAAESAERWVCEKMAIAADQPVQTPTERYVRFRDVVAVLIDEMGEGVTLGAALERLDAEHAAMQAGTTIDHRAGSA